jgi:uncharacterized membrane protein YgaE (UPF0421/DUF939 family)
MPQARDDRGLADLLETAADRVSLRERWLRLRNTAPRIVIVAVAATLAYAISLHLLDHPRPFFAPIAVVVVSGVTFGATSRRAIQLALGVTIGILVADLAVQLIGTGTWQIAAIVFFGMCAVVFLGGDQLAVNQAASAGVLIATVAIPGDESGLSRFADALVGAGVALAFNFVLFPVNPLKLARGALDPAARRIAGVLDAVADALERRDEAFTARALELARDLDAHVADMRADIATSGEVARLALARRGQRDAVERYERAMDQVVRAQRDAASLARAADRALRRGDDVPPAVVAGLRDLAASLRDLPSAWVDRGARERARERALSASSAATAGLEETRNLSASLVVGQTRMVAFDVLRATGLSRDAAREEIRESVDGDEAERTREAAEALVEGGARAEVEAARPPEAP